MFEEEIDFDSLHDPEAFEDREAPVPSIDPVRWDDFAVFRETFLLSIERAKANSAVRAFGSTLYDMALECGRTGGDPDGWAVREMRAVIADLRFLQGYLDRLGRFDEDSILTDRQERIFQNASQFAVECGELADRIEGDLEVAKNAPVPE